MYGMKRPESNGGQGDALDMNRRDDRAALARGIASGWDIEHDQLSRYRRALDLALGEAIKAKNVRHITSCVRTMVAMVAQVQADEARATPGAGGVEIVVRYADGSVG